MKHVCIIAEAGVNHNGSLRLAKKMADRAKEAGADYIKFQTFIPRNLVSKFAGKAAYQKQTTDAAESQLQMLEKLALTQEEYRELKRYCDDIKVGFLSSPFDLESIRFLEELNMDFWKIPSGEITNLPYLESIARTGKNILLSTGMSEMDEVQRAIRILEENGAQDVILLHCNTQYPTPYEDVNLNAMVRMKKIFEKSIGYSDHTKGIEIPIAATALGAEVIEKHFTLDRNMVGPDHRASLEPEELETMIISIRNIEKALGSGEKTASDSERENRAAVRKSIVASRCIKKGEILSSENITVKRPGNGISPFNWYEVIGTVAIRDFEEDELIEI